MDNPYLPPESPPPPLPVAADGVPGLKNPRALALLALGLYAVSLLAEGLQHVIRTILADIPPAGTNPHDSYYVVAGPGPLEWLMIATGLASMVFYFLWKFRAAANAWILNPAGMRISPAMSVVWYFIPIMNFFKPCQAMAGIARASYGSTFGVAIWWTTQVVGTLGGFGIGAFTAADIGVTRPGLAEHLYLVWSIMTFIYAWQLIMRITRAQTERCIS